MMSSSSERMPEAGIEGGRGGRRSFKAAVVGFFLRGRGQRSGSGGVFRLLLKGLSGGGGRVRCRNLEGGAGCCICGC